MLDGWPGSMVVVSHDRYFLERVTDHVLALVGGKLAYLPGGVDEYLELRDRERTGAAAARQEAGSSGSPASGQSSAARQRTAGKELTRLERQLGKLSEQEAALNEALAQSAADYAALIEYGAQLRALQAEKASMEERWLELAEELSL